MAVTTQQEVSKLSEMIEVCRIYLSTQKAESKYEAVKEELSFIYKQILEYERMGHSSNCRCSKTAEIFAKEMPKPPDVTTFEGMPAVELVISVDDKGELVSEVGFRVFGRFFATSQAFVTTFDDLEKLDITPYECVKFVKEMSERQVAVQSVTQPLAHA